MTDLFSDLKNKINGKGKKIVFPEGEDIRIIKASSRLNDEGILTPILLGNKESISSIAQENNINIYGIEIIDYLNVSEDEKNLFADLIVEIRNGKADKEKALTMITDPNYYGVTMVKLGQADGMVSGATDTTANTVRPAIQIIKAKSGTKRISGAFLMRKDDKKYIFSDSAININVDSQTMADIAVQSINTAREFGIDPKVAMLSFSTKGSAKSDETEKVIEATKLAKEIAPQDSENIDGELQFDAAIESTVAKSKAPDSKVAGNANVFIFPGLDAANIGYKIAQRLGGFEAIGPILQGLDKPVNDLSRGSNEDDIYKLAIITAVQSL